MPKKIILGPFEYNPNFNRAEYIREKIDEFRTRMDDLLQYVDSMSNATLQLIAMFSIIDSMAQEWRNYPDGKCKEAFCAFVLNHQSKYDYLDKVEPVTLFYHVEDQLAESVSIPGLPAEKEVTLNSLGVLDMRLLRDVLPSGKSEEILKYLATKKGGDFADKKAKEHRLISLIYRMRSKATHEMTGLGAEIGPHSNDKVNEPYYMDINTTDINENNMLSYDAYELAIPNGFIRSILGDCIDSYLSECTAQLRLPFNNNKLMRKHRLSWYDK